MRTCDVNIGQEVWTVARQPKPYIVTQIHETSLLAAPKMLSGRLGNNDGFYANSIEPTRQAAFNAWVAKTNQQIEQLRREKWEAIKEFWR